MRVQCQPDDPLPFPRDPRDNFLSIAGDGRALRNARPKYRSPHPSRMV